MGSMSSLDLTRQYASYAGVDIRIIMAGSPVGTMQAISYAIQREKAPIYVMGKVDPISFSRGKRGIAGTMISLLLDNHLIESHDGFKKSTFIQDNDEHMTVAPTDMKGAGGFADKSITPDGTAFSSTDLTANYKPQTPTYVDQILPFDVVIIAANEYGQASQMRIYGCEILNEGSGFSIDDIVIENQMTYVCRTIMPWTKMGVWKEGATFNTTGELSGTFG